MGGNSWRSLLVRLWRQGVAIILVEALLAADGSNDFFLFRVHRAVVTG